MSNNNSDLLSRRLKNFRRWLIDECGGKIHSSVCIVNGDATDGTKQAPVLLLDHATTPEDPLAGRVGCDRKNSNNDDDDLWKLYDRTMGCQVRAVREIKLNDTLFHIPRTAMITPDLVARSDAGMAIFQCCSERNVTLPSSFWDMFANTSTAEREFFKSVSSTTGTQVLVKVLHERKKAETAYLERTKETTNKPVVLAKKGVITTRAPFLAFLIQQRFVSSAPPPVSVKSSPQNGVPATFAPYARTLPNCVSVPLCWKRGELALLSGCVTGVTLLQEVAASTQLLVAEFTALLEAGILERFPKVFPPGLLTWDRWVWAAAVFTSRVFPSQCYHMDTATDDTIKSPRDVWNEIGVMVPLLDMFNHEIDENQLTWVSIDQSAIAHKKIRKGAEIFSVYGQYNNFRLLQNYGFVQLNNAADEVRLGWGFAEAVGHVKPPSHFTLPYTDAPDFVYESTDKPAFFAWWTPERFQLLERQVFNKPESSATFASLKRGKKMSVIAYTSGVLHPLFLVATAVATMPPSDLAKQQADTDRLVLSARHQVILRRYLQVWFARKLEKLLQNLEDGLKGYFPSLKLWCKHENGGLSYQGDKNNNEEGDPGCVGWQSFFEQNAYTTAMEVENRYYGLGSDSCVLALYDGQLQALQKSLDGLADQEKLAEGLYKQLEDLNCQLLPKDEEENTGESAADATAKVKEESSSENGEAKAAEDDLNPLAVKLHVGNLSYMTTPSDLYDYFSSLYGQANVLECHIPVERFTGRSRGFGFVAMPEEIAQQALEPNRKHEVDGRALKVAKSNSAGTSSVQKVEKASLLSSDRCRACGYRPKYCSCSKPDLPPASQRPPPPAAQRSPPPPPRVDALIPDPRRDADYRRYHVGRDHRPYDNDPRRYDDYHDDRYFRRRERGYDYDDRRSSSRRSYEEGERRKRSRSRSRERSHSRDRRRKKSSKRRHRSESRSEAS